MPSIISGAPLNSPDHIRLKAISHRDSDAAVAERKLRLCRSISTPSSFPCGSEQTRVVATDDLHRVVLLRRRRGQGTRAGVGGTEDIVSPVDRVAGVVESFDCGGPTLLNVVVVKRNPASPLPGRLGLPQAVVSRQVVAVDGGRGSAVAVQAIGDGDSGRRGGVLSFGRTSLGHPPGVAGKVGRTKDAGQRKRTDYVLDVVIAGIGVPLLDLRRGFIRADQVLAGE